MPVTYNLIASNTLTTNTASVTFSAIPNTFTDLVLRISARSTSNSRRSVENYIFLNNDTSSLYSYTVLQGSGSAISSAKFSNVAIEFGQANGNLSTSNTFANSEIYIPNYAGTTVKQISNFTGQEDNQTTAYINATAGLYRGTAPITSITISQFSAESYMSGSSFFLYGIKNS